MKIVAEPSCARHLSGCTTSLPAKTGITRKELREPRRTLREDRSEIREASEALRECRGQPRRRVADSEGLGGNPGGFGAGLWESLGATPRGLGGSAGAGAGGPGNRASGGVSWTGGGQASARIADCPGGPARRGNRRVHWSVLARPLHLIHAGASSFRLMTIGKPVTALRLICNGA